MDWIRVADLCLVSIRSISRPWRAPSLKEESERVVKAVGRRGVEIGVVKLLGVRK